MFMEMTFLVSNFTKIKINNFEFLIKFLYGNEIGLKYKIWKSCISNVQILIICNLLTTN